MNHRHHISSALYKSVILIMSESKPVLILASSGGGTATLGHTEPATLLQAIDDELSSIHAFVATVLYVALEDGSSMDFAKWSESQGILYVARTRSSRRERLAVLPETQDTLDNVNQYIAKQQYDEYFAAMIKKRNISALVCISFAPFLFPKTLAAAASAKIPVTGSGGTSLSQAASQHNLLLVGNVGGSVATTTRTRAVSYTSALAQHWKRPYQPHSSRRKERQRQQQAPSITSVLNSCLGVFWGVCLLKHVTNYLLANELLQASIIHSDYLLLKQLLETFAIPMACSVIMATSSNSTTNHHQYSPGMIMAAILAATTSSQSLLGGLLSGKLVNLFWERLVFQCVQRNVPATMTSLLSSGGLGAVIALLLLPMVPLFRMCTQYIRLAISWTVSAGHVGSYRFVFGGVWGILSCYGSKVGYYHAVHLPLILVEMELGDPSFLGAVDELTLVLVCAGICMGRLLIIRVSAISTTSNVVADRKLCQRAVTLNLLCGDFVEACYPYMEQSSLVNVAGYLASGLATAVLFLPVDNQIRMVPKSMAYLPLPIAVLLTGEQWRQFVFSCMIAFGIPFLATCTAEGRVRQARRTDKEK
jgi:hypothetical protein